MSAAPHRSTVRVAAVAGLALLLALALSAAAGAALPWQPCPTAGYDCAHLDVPLDRSGAVPGTVSLAVARAHAQSNPRNVAVVALAGGPGQAALPLTTDFAQVLAPAIADRDLLVFDQRGTGASGALRCGSLTRGLNVLAMASGCAAELGARRGFYRTADSVEDLEALRVAGGYDKLVLYGVSYGTKVAEAYASAHPDRVEALVLDSVVLPEGPDPFSRSTMATAPRVLGDLCAGGACRSATPDVRGDLRRLAAKLRAGSLRGKVVLASGRQVRYRMGQLQLLDILVAGDFNPSLRAELPGSMRSALRGDAAPLLRLGVRSEALTVDARRRSATAFGFPDSADSDALFLATTCEELPFPWTRSAGAQTRLGEAASAAKRLPRAQLGPFSPDAALEGGAIPFCLGWPAASPPPVAPAPLPPVRTLVLDGQMDLRTPYEDAAALASRIPGAALVEVPNTGHSVLGSDEGTCAETALKTFFAGTTPGACPATDNPFWPTPKPPTHLTAMHPLGARGRVGLTIGAVAATVTDAQRQIVGDALALGRVPKHVGGLRAGRAVVEGTSAFRLERYQYVPGVVVSGTVAFRGAAKLTVHGGGTAAGLLAISGTGAVSGRLGGHRVSLSASSSTPRLPTLRQVLAQPRLGR